MTTTRMFRLLKLWIAFWEFVMEEYGVHLAIMLEYINVGGLCNNRMGNAG